MSKRERIEDLGRIYARLERLLYSSGDIEHEVNSKHRWESFVEKYTDQNNMRDLFERLKGLFEELWEIKGIAMGDVDD